MDRAGSSLSGQRKRPWSPLSVLGQRQYIRQWQASDWSRSV